MPAPLEQQKSRPRIPANTASGAGAGSPDGTRGKRQLRTSAAPQVLETWLPPAIISATREVGYATQLVVCSSERNNEGVVSFQGLVARPQDQHAVVSHPELPQRKITMK